jgi:hypothetical protein
VTNPFQSIIGTQCDQDNDAERAAHEELVAEEIRADLLEDALAEQSPNKQGEHSTPCESGLFGLAQQKIETGLSTLPSLLRKPLVGGI